MECKTPYDRPSMSFQENSYNPRNITRPQELNKEMGGRAVGDLNQVSGVILHLDIYHSIGHLD